MKEGCGSPPSLDIVFMMVRAGLDRQFEQSSSLDTKLGMTIGLSGVILAALLGFQSLNLFNTITTWLVIVAVTLVLLSLLIAACGVFLIGKFQWAPRPETLREFYLTEKSEETKTVIVDTQITVYKQNRRHISLKAQLLKCSFVIVLCSAFLIGISVLYNLA